MWNACLFGWFFLMKDYTRSSCHFVDESLSGVNKAHLISDTALRTSPTRRQGPSNRETPLSCSRKPSPSDLILLSLSLSVFFVFLSVYLEAVQI